MIWPFFTIKKMERRKKNHTPNFTWISWILLKPSLQKNSIKLETVPGPGISARVFTDFFWAVFFGVTSLSGVASSRAVPNAPLVPDLCKQRKAKRICLLWRPHSKFLQHTVVNFFMTDIFFGLLGKVWEERFNASKCAVLACAKARSALRGSPTIGWERRLLKLLLKRRQTWKRIGCLFEGKKGRDDFVGVFSPP